LFEVIFLNMTLLWAMV